MARIDQQALARLSEAERDLQGVKEHSNLNRTLIIAGLWVVGIGFATLLISVGGIFQSYLAAKTAALQDLTNKIDKQGEKIDLLMRYRQ